MATATKEAGRTVKGDEFDHAGCEAALLAIRGGREDVRRGDGVSGECRTAKVRMRRNRAFG